MDFVGAKSNLLLDEGLKRERLVRPELLLGHRFVPTAIGCTFGLGNRPTFWFLVLKSETEL